MNDIGDEENVDGEEIKLIYNWEEKEKMRQNIGEILMRARIEAT